MGAFEYTALDAGGKEQSGILEGDTPRHIRQMLRERQLAPGRRQRGGAEGSDAPEVIVQHRAACIGCRSVALHAPARDTRACRTSSRGVLARGLTADREAAHSEYRHGSAGPRHGGPHPRQRPHRVSESLSGNLSRHRLGRRAGRPPRQRARAARGLHREPRGYAPESPGGHAVPDRVEHHVLRDRMRPDDLRGTEGGGGVRGEQGEAARGSPRR